MLTSSRPRNEPLSSLIRLLLSDCSSTNSTFCSGLKDLAFQRAMIVLHHHRNIFLVTSNICYTILYHYTLNNFFYIPASMDKDHMRSKKSQREKPPKTREIFLEVKKIFTPKSMWTIGQLRSNNIFSKIRIKYKWKETPLDISIYQALIFHNSCAIQTIMEPYLCGFVIIRPKIIKMAWLFILFHY